MVYNGEADVLIGDDQISDFKAEVVSIFQITSFCVLEKRSRFIEDNCLDFTSSKKLNCQYQLNLKISQSCVPAPHKL